MGCDSQFDGYDIAQQAGAPRLSVSKREANDTEAKLVKTAHAYAEAMRRFRVAQKALEEHRAMDVAMQNDLTRARQDVDSCRTAHDEVLQEITFGQVVPPGAEPPDVTPGEINSQGRATQRPR